MIYDQTPKPIKPGCKVLVLAGSACGQVITAVQRLEPGEAGNSRNFPVWRCKGPIFTYPQGRNNGAVRYDSLTIPERVLLNINPDREMRQETNPYKKVR